MSKSVNPPEKRNYKREDRYEDTPEQIKHREARNRLHADAERKAGHHIAEDVAHKIPMAKGGASTPANTKIETAAKNRSWRRGQRGYNVPEDK